MTQRIAADSREWPRIQDIRSASICVDQRLIHLRVSFPRMHRLGRSCRRILQSGFPRLQLQIHDDVSLQSVARRPAAVALLDPAVVNAVGTDAVDDGLFRIRPIANRSAGVGIVRNAIGEFNHGWARIPRMGAGQMVHYSSLIRGIRAHPWFNPPAFTPVAASADTSPRRAIPEIPRPRVLSHFAVQSNASFTAKSRGTRRSTRKPSTFLIFSFFAPSRFILISDYRKRDAEGNRIQISNRR